MKSRISLALGKRLQKLVKTDPQLGIRIEKQLSLFSQNHRHPSLKTHKLSGELDNLWSISITKSLRMTYFLDEIGACFIDVGTHDQVYPALLNIRVSSRINNPLLDSLTHE